MSFIYTTPYNHGPGNPAQCRASCWPQGSFRSSQCSRKPSVFREVDGVTYGFCKTHDPVAEEERKAKRLAEWNAKLDERKRLTTEQEKIKAAQAACVEAIKAIAAGHNDPRSLASQALSLFPNHPTLHGEEG